MGPLWGGEYGERRELLMDSCVAETRLFGGWRRGEGGEGGGGGEEGGGGEDRGDVGNPLLLFGFHSAPSRHMCWRDFFNPPPPDFGKI